MKIVSSGPFFVCLAKSITEVKLNSVLKLSWVGTRLSCIAVLAHCQIGVCFSPRQAGIPCEHGWLPGRECAEQVLLEIWSAV